VRAFAEPLGAAAAAVRTDVVGLFFGHDPMLLDK